MAKLVKKSVIPLYLIALVWVVWALFLPLLTWWQVLLCAALSAAAFLVGKRFCKDKVVDIPDPPERTGNQALDQFLQEGRDALSQLRALETSIQQPPLKVQIGQLITLCEKILAQVRENPQKLPLTRQFMRYYLPTTLKLLNTYDKMDDIGTQGGKVEHTLETIQSVMQTIVSAFEKQLDSLFGEESLDISTDIQVLQTLLKREGWTEEDFSTKETPPSQDNSSPSAGQTLRGGR